jgi:hypothetical protein
MARMYPQKVCPKGQGLGIVIDDEVMPMFDDSFENALR